MSATPPIGTRLVLVSEDADVLFFGRDDRGNRLTFEWGEPDEHGWYTPTITSHEDGWEQARDRVIAAARAFVDLDAPSRRAIRVAVADLDAVIGR